MNRFAQIIDRSTSSNLKRWLLPMLTVVLLAALIFALTARSVGSGETNAQAPKPERFVRVAPVELETVEQPLRLPGLLRAAETADLAFLHAGHLAERRVRRGEPVNAGQVLALLHNPALSPALSASEARLREVQTELAQADRELQRVEDLQQRSLVSTEELERARARRSALAEAVEQAEARRREASEQLAEASLRAPFSGTVIDLHAESGEFVSAGQPILALAGNGSLEVELKISAQRASQMRSGQAVRVGETAHQLDLEARVIEIGLAAPGRPAPLRLVVDDPPAHWQPGLGVIVELDFAREPRLQVPLSAVIDPGGDQAVVFLIRDGKVERVPVQLGPVSAGRIAVSGSLNDADRVVIAGHGQLLDGESVRVLP